MTKRRKPEGVKTEFTDLTVDEAIHLVKVARGMSDEFSHEQTAEMVSKAYGIERKTLEDFPFEVLKSYESLMLDHIHQVGVTWSKEKEDADAAASDRQPVDRITIEGEEYLIPMDLGRNATALQWIHIDQQIRAAAQAKASEVELFPIVLGTLLTQDGEKYTGAQAAQRFALMGKARFIDAARIMAFFFASSTDFSDTLTRHFPEFGILTKLSRSLDGISSVSNGDGLRLSLASHVLKASSTPFTA